MNYRREVRGTRKERTAIRGWNGEKEQGKMGARDSEVLTTLR
jgi:hypothetical protein